MSTNTAINPIDRVLTQVNKVVLGYQGMIEMVAYAMVADGHVMLTGVPGLAKSVTANAFRRAIGGATTSRFQMTPDMKPTDITGAEILNLKTKEFEVRKGKIFANVVLADEINRTGPRTQSALLEAMAERTVSIGGVTFPVPSLFTVLATRNPLEQEGTYPLPEAQLDRFLFELTMGYTTEEAEILMLKNQRLLRGVDPYAVIDPTQSLNVEEMLALREQVRDIHVADCAYEYIVHLVRATRPGDKRFDSLTSVQDPNCAKFKEVMEVGGSPRAEQALLAAAQVRAFHMGREFILPEDVQYVLFAVLGHRVIFNRRGKADKHYTKRDAVNALALHVPFHQDMNDYAN